MPVNTTTFLPTPSCSGREWHKDEGLAMLAIISILLIIGCAGSKTISFQDKIRSMSDQDLINYFHGTEDRIKVIQRDQEKEIYDFDIDPEKNLLYPRNSFYLGTEGNNLLQKQKKILKELNRRGISP